MAARAARDKLILKEPLLKASQAALEEARRRDRERIERASRIDADRIAAAAAREAIDRLAEAGAGRIGAAGREARMASEAAFAGDGGDDQALARLADLSALIAEAELRPDRVARRAAVAEAARRLQSIEAALEEAPAPDDLVDRIEAAGAGHRRPEGGDRGRLRPHRDRCRAGGEGRIRLDGGFDRLRQAQCVEPLVIDAGGLATVTITLRWAAMRSGRSSRRSRPGFRRCCARAGFPDAAALRLAVQKRRTLEQDRSGALGALRGLGLAPAVAAPSCRSSMRCWSA